MGRSQRDAEKRGRKARLERGNIESKSVLRSGETRLVRRAIEAARPRSKNDTIVRLAGDRRQGELQKSGVTFAWTNLKVEGHERSCPFLLFRIPIFPSSRATVEGSRRASL